MKKRVALFAICLASNALAQPAADHGAPPPMLAAPQPTTDPMLAPMSGQAPGQPAQQVDKPPEPKPKKKEPGRGDFDAGGQARFPSGPDDTGTYKSFNW